MLRFGSHVLVTRPNNGNVSQLTDETKMRNNINALLPNGQFGTRLEGGKDSASERYIFTQLVFYCRYIFDFSK